MKVVNTQLGADDEENRSTRTHHRIPGGVTFINSGTIKHDHDPGFIVADFAARKVTFFELEGAGLSESLVAT